MNYNMKIKRMQRDMESLKALNKVLIKKNVISIKELEDELSGKQ